MCNLLAQLRKLGCRVAPFPVLFWQHGIFLPYFFWDLPSKLLQRKSEIASAFEILDDDVSRQTYVAQVQLRLRADFAAPGVPAPGEQYFPGLFSISPDECFVDCGAYTGDTIQSFISHADNAYRKVIAFEADPSVTPVLETFMSDLGRGVLYKAAVSATSGRVRFSGDGIGGGCVTGTVTASDAGSGSGVHTRRCWTCTSHDCALRDVEVPCVRMDEAIATEHPTFIKMDIEGAELQALEGARSLIQRDRPVLAVCGYHAPDHLWRVPMFLKSLAPDSLIFVRSHCVDGLDTVWYAVPPERRVQTVAARMSKLTSRKRSRVRTQGSTT